MLAFTLKARADIPQLWVFPIDVLANNCNKKLEFNGSHFTGRQEEGLASGESDCKV